MRRIVLLLVTSAGELLLRARTMAGGGFRDRARRRARGAHAHPFRNRLDREGRRAGGAARLVGRSSRAARTAGLWRGSRASRSPRASSATRPIAATCRSTALIDWLHVAGGRDLDGRSLLPDGLVLPEAARWPRDAAATLLRRFSTLAGVVSRASSSPAACYNACVQVGSLHALATTTYGRILVAKVALVVAMACLGAANRFAVLPALGADTIASVASRLAWCATSPGKPRSHCSCSAARRC